MGGSHIAIDYESMGLAIICNVIYLIFLYELHPDADISSLQFMCQKRRKEQNKRYKCLKCANYCMLLCILCIIAHYIINDDVIKTKCVYEGCVELTCSPAQ